MAETQFIFDWFILVYGFHSRKATIFGSFQWGPIFNAVTCLFDLKVVGMK